MVAILISLKAAVKRQLRRSQEYFRGLSAQEDAKGGAENEPPAHGLSPLLRTGGKSFEEDAHIVQNRADQ